MSGTPVTGIVFGVFLQALFHVQSVRQTLASVCSAELLLIPLPGDPGLVSLSPDKACISPHLSVSSFHLYSDGQEATVVVVYAPLSWQIFWKKNHTFCTNCMGFFFNSFF